LIVPNILIGTGVNISGQPSQNLCNLKSKSPIVQSFYCKNARLYNRHANTDMSHAALFEGEYYWPAFRTFHSTVKEVPVLEPSYYYRIEHDMNIKAPDPVFVIIDIGTKTEVGQILEHILSKLERFTDSPRLVLDIRDSDQYELTDDESKLHLEWLNRWAKSSVSSWGKFTIDKSAYVSLPAFDDKSSSVSISEPKILVDGVHMCKTFLNKVVGNRTCFSKCKAPNLSSQLNA